MQLPSILATLMMATAVSAQWKGALNCNFPSNWQSFDREIQSSWAEVQKIPGMAEISMTARYTAAKGRRDEAHLSKRALIPTNDKNYKTVKNVVCGILRYQMPSVSCSELQC